MRKVFDCTLGALWRLYVRLIVDGIFAGGYGLESAAWALAIAVTILLICAIPTAFILLSLLVIAVIVFAIDFPLHAACFSIGIGAICILPLLALKSYKRSKAKAFAASIASSRPKASKKTKNAFNQ